MDDEFSRRLNSFVTTMDFANGEEWTPVWTGQTPMMFGTKLGEAAVLVAGLQDWVQRQAQTSAGATEAKKQEHDQLESAAFVLAQALVTYFMDQDDLTAAEPFRRSRSYWQTLKDQDLLARSQAVIDAATPLTTGAEAAAIASGYGISAAAVTALTGERTDFADIVGQPTAARASRKAYTSLMRAQFLPVTGKFRDLDRLVVQFAARPSGPEFVAGWMAARNVVGDTGGAGGGTGGGGGTVPAKTVLGSMDLGQDGNWHISTMTAEGADVFEVQHKLVSDADWTTDAADAPGPDFHFPALPPGDYLTRVRGVNDTGSGEWSDESPFTLS